MIGLQVRWRESGLCLSSSEFTRTRKVIGSTDDDFRERGGNQLKLLILNSEKRLDADILGKITRLTTNHSDFPVGILKVEI